MLPIFPYFDDRETGVRPNVLIELGAPIGLSKPHLYFNYGNNRTVKIDNRHEPITTASDLAGMLYPPYTSYRGLFVEFARRCGPVDAPIKGLVEKFGGAGRN